MKAAKDLHIKAMSFYEDSLAAKFKGDETQRIKLLKKALKFEQDAAILLRERYDLEPTRSKLFASAATMAYQLSEYKESEKLVSFGLSGSPPDDIAEELRDLFDKVNFYRHLTTKGIELSEDEFRFTLGSGNSVMKGMARGNEVISRIEAVEALYSRTVQRINKKPYQTQGRLSSKEDNIIQLYYKTPQAASFAMVFKIPGSKQSSLFPELSTVKPYIDEMIECIDLVNEGNMIELKKRIPDESYFQSFIINTRKIAPDGSDIKQVGFTVYRNHVEKIHPFSKKQSEITMDTVVAEVKKEELEVNANKEKMTVTGTLLVSDSPKKFITVVNETKQYNKKGGLKKSKFKKYKIKFTTEAQKELVREHYEEDVTVEVWKYEDNSLEFIDLKLS